MSKRRIRNPALYKYHSLLQKAEMLGSLIIIKHRGVKNLDFIFLDDLRMAGYLSSSVSKNHETWKFTAKAKKLLKEFKN